MGQGLDMGKKLIEVYTELPFNLIKHHFPIRPCFQMGTNKVQGQTLDFVGAYLPEDIMSHGQLHVALSRGCNSNSVDIHIHNNNGYIINTVYRAINLL